MSAHHLRQLLFVLSAALSDGMSAAAQHVGVKVDSEALALIVLRVTGPIGVGQLGAAAGMSSTGAVRLADRLCDQGWALRADTSDNRRRVLQLSTLGHATADLLMQERATQVQRLVHPLCEHEIIQLADFISRMVATVVRDETDVGRLCRWCARGRCPNCPATLAAGQRRTSLALLG